MNIKANIERIRESVPASVKLIAVSKTKPVEYIESAYAANQRVFGESKAQELAEKYEVLPKDIEWHFIGHLQTNKVKYIAPFVSLIHSVDSLKLLEAINKEALKNDRIIDCLLQFHIAEEETKFGLNEEEGLELLTSSTFKTLKNIRIVGVMGIATFTDSEDEVRKEFRTLKSIFEKLKQNSFKEVQYFKEISMGMSDDYQWAIEEGSTMVRIGSSIFGVRNYG
ncbi:YggS family pyridoxal phosphate-dependent enzyme [Odoribacter sp. OttesenSCG-928-A06]|nr:YggS family pyridoxal phosphate-dependent enzyme [Odoribacter sp. OttesenSCG-928-A06]